MTISRSDTSGSTRGNAVSSARPQFPHALGVALIPDEITSEHVLAITDVAFQSVQPKDGLRLSKEKVPHVSLFQNMFQDPQSLASVVELALRNYPIRNTCSIQPPPNDVCIWAGDRPFINHEITPDLALFHDFMLLECIMNGRDTLCAGSPADHRPLKGLSTEQDKAYRETGYVFSGAGSELARQHRMPWNAFTIPHFTAGVIDWDTNTQSDDSIDLARCRISSEMRAAMNDRKFTECHFDKVAIFRVQPGGVYVPGAENTIKEYPLPG